MLVIFGVGYSAVYGVRKAKSTLISGKDLTIPLGSFINFNLEGTRLGSIRSLTIRRDSPKLVTGFEVRVRVDSSAFLDRLQNCHISVNDAKHIDERTRFMCLPGDTTGYRSFGEVRAELNSDDSDRTLVIPLLLPLDAIADIQNHRSNDMEGVPGLSDSIASAVQTRVQQQRMTYRDSIRVAEAERVAAKYQHRADSIRAKLSAPPATPPAAPTPVKPVKP
jgi:hypothetical protein